jgi:hypothetical protein
MVECFSYVWTLRNQTDAPNFNVAPTTFEPVIREEKDSAEWQLLQGSFVELVVIRRPLVVKSLALR